MWNIPRIATNTALLCAALVVATGANLALADSTGGSIGSNEKTLSGSVQTPHPAEAERPAGRSRPARQTRRSSPQEAGGGGVARFDGNWTVVLSAGCAAAGTASVTVSGGRLTSLGVSGTVSPNGGFRTVSQAGAATVISTGRINGSTGSGTYRQSDGCSGSIRAIKS
jgi:hypothetical protein